PPADGLPRPNAAQPCRWYRAADGLAAARRTTDRDRLRTRHLRRPDRSEGLRPRAAATLATDTASAAANIAADRGARRLGSGPNRWPGARRQTDWNNSGKG